MSIVESMGDALARDVLAAQQELDDDMLVKRVSDIVEASSSGLHEAFMAAVRARMAYDRAQKHVTDCLAEAGKTLPES